MARLVSLDSLKILAVACSAAVLAHCGTPASTSGLKDSGFALEQSAEKVWSISTKKVTFHIKSFASQTMRCNFSVGFVMTGAVDPSVEVNYRMQRSDDLVFPRQDQIVTFDFSQKYNDFRQTYGQDLILKSFSESLTTTNCTPAGGGGSSPPADSTPSWSQRSLPPGSQMLVSSRSGRCLNLNMPSLNDFGSYQNGTSVMQYDCPPPNNVYDNNYWYTQAVGSGEFKLVSEHSRKCVAGGWPYAEYNSIVQNDCDSSARLIAESLPGRNEFRVRVADTNYCITLQGDGIANQTSTYLRQCWSATSPDAALQLWSTRPAH